MIKKFDKDLVTTIENYSAYVYKITITFKDGTKKIYIGAHQYMINIIFHQKMRLF